MEHDITYEIALMAILGGNDEQTGSDRPPISDGGVSNRPKRPSKRRGTNGSGKDNKGDEL